MYNEEDYLMLSGIQHYYFCKRQWALIHIERYWADNESIAKGTNLHEKADKPLIKEKRKDLIISRALPVSSSILGFSGILDIVEFRSSDKGIKIPGKSGLWWPTIIEYKKGKEKVDERDTVQLVAQTICLEEKFNINIEFGYIYYFETNSRLKVDIIEGLKIKTKNLANKMHELYELKTIPKAESYKNCRLCSLVDVCMPRLTKKKKSVQNYLYGDLQ